MLNALSGFGKSSEIDKLLFALFRTMASDPERWAGVKPITPAQIEELLKRPGIRQGLIEAGVIEEDAPPYDPQEAVQVFLRERCDLGNDRFRVGVLELYSAYQDWAREKQVVPAGKTRFGVLLRKVASDIRITRPWRYRGRNRPQIYCGIRLRPRQGGMTPW